MIQLFDVRLCVCVQTKHKKFVCLLNVNVKYICSPHVRTTYMPHLE